MPQPPVSPARRRLAALPVLVLPLCLMTQFAHAAPTAATIIIGGKTVSLSVTPYVGLDGQVYAPVDAVHLMGANYTPGKNSVTITGANGRQTTVPFVPREGHELVALQKVALAIGASADWQPTTQTLTLRARLEMVRQNPDSLSIYTSYPVTYQVQHIKDPNRVYVDMFGLDLAAAPAAIPVLDQDGPGANVVRIRSGQINDNTVRITIDLKRDMGYQVVSGLETDRIKVALGAVGHPAPIQVAQTPPEPRSLPGRSLPPLPISAPGMTTRPVPLNVPVAVNPPKPTLPSVPPSEGVRITSVSVNPVSDALTQIAITATGQAKFRTETLDNPNRLAFDLAGAQLDAAVSPELPCVGSIIKAVRAGILHTGVVQFGRVVVDLTRLVGYSVSRQVADNGSVTYLINLQTSSSATHSNGNSLAGKVVVVDPGHGAHDSGALAPDGSMEKNFTLAIGKKLRDTLVQNGATVYLTRSDDTFLPVMARPQFATGHGADYFISIHCDSSGAQNSHSGTTVYFHSQDAVCHRMASDIINRVAEISGIPPDGVKSDTIRFQTGFGVLRGSPEPAVLVECGYMNNDADLAKLKDPETQQHIAEGIVAGLRDFIADRAAP